MKRNIAITHRDARDRRIPFAFSSSCLCINAACMHNTISSTTGETNSRTDLNIYHNYKLIFNRNNNTTSDVMRHKAISYVSLAKLFVGFVCGVKQLAIRRLHIRSVTMYTHIHGGVHPYP